MSAARVCPACGRVEPIEQGAPLWPSSWQCSGCGHSLPRSDGIPLTAPSLASAGPEVEPPDFELLYQVERSHFWFVARRRLLLALCARYAPQARLLLEVGCGTGNVIDALARARPWTRIAATDLHSHGLALARTRVPPAVELFQADARRLPVRECFELAGAFDVLEHIAEDEAVIASIRSTLVDGGVFLTAVPQHPSLWSAADDVADHVRRYERGELDRKLSAGGFEILFSTSYAVSLLPLMALSRRLSGRSAAGRDRRAVVQREFGIPPAVNRVLTAVLNAEASLTQRGVRWPAGGSRVVAARKR